MESLRRRVPFRVSDDSNDTQEDELLVLDEQEQDELIEKLRNTTVASNRLYLLMLYGLLGLSCTLQLFLVLRASKESPLLAIFPAKVPDPDPPISTPTLFSLISVALHINLFLLIYPDEHGSRLHVRTRGLDISPLSYPLAYALATIAPCLCLFLRRTWQTTLWYCVTPAVIFMVQTMQTSIMEGNGAISELESKRYVAPGA